MYLLMNTVQACAKFLPFDNDKKTKGQKDKRTNRQKDNNTKGQKGKRQKDKTTKRPEREFSIVMSGQFRTLAMF